LISINQIHVNDKIWSVQQTWKYTDESIDKPNKKFSDFQEIMLHFILKLTNKDGTGIQLNYCQLKISQEAIRLLDEYKGRLPANFM
jgi:hypothetical protein